MLYSDNRNQPFHQYHFQPYSLRGGNIGGINLGSSQTILELVAAAQLNVKIYEDRISDILKHIDGLTGSSAQGKELRGAVASLELVMVDMFSVFEARMQHHFKRGPFSRKLTSLLLEAGETDLADRVHQHYLMINVLKHGKGASYRELLNAPSYLFVIKTPEEITSNEEHAPSNFIDVSTPGLFNGLASTIIDAYHFLESR